MFNQETTPEKNPVVTIVNNQPITTSLDIAESFGKRHDHVLRDINALELPEEFRLPNFGEISYFDAYGRKMPMYQITRDGFIILVMGYNGERAMQFKLAYLKAFNKMEEALRNQLRALPAPAEYYGEGFLKGLRFERELRAAMLNYDIDDATVRNLCFYRSIGLSQPEAARLCIISSKQVWKIESVLKAHGCDVPKTPNPSTRKLRVRQAWEKLLEGIGKREISAPVCTEVANG